MYLELDWLENRARLSPNKEAIVDAEQSKSWTFSEVNQRSKATASWLRKKGVRKGDRVALLSPNHISYFDLLFACAKLGAIFVPINWRLSAHEINYILQDCTPMVLGYHSSFSEVVNELFPTQPTLFTIDREEYFDKDSSAQTEIEITEKDPLAILYTGGTTGNPKGVILSHQSIMWNGINTILSWNLTNEDITLTYMPLFHTGGLNALSIPILMIGGKVVIASAFKPTDAIAYLNDYKCTIVLFVPTMYHMIVHTNEFKQSTFPTVHTFLSGGAPCPLEIYEEFSRKGLLFKEGYGLTEAGPNNFYMDPSHVGEKRGSVGKPMLFNSVKIMREDGIEADMNEVGELYIRGKHQFRSYWNNQVATEEALSDGWLVTGDLAKRDDHGYYYIVGRKKDMIITGGENVYPLEVENWISTLPEVDEVAVVGIPDPKWGERVVAFVVVKENIQMSSKDIMQHCAIKLGNYKIPQDFLFLDELPKTHVGKIDKNALKEKHNYLKKPTEFS